MKNILTFVIAILFYPAIGQIDIKKDSIVTGIELRDLPKIYPNPAVNILMIEGGATLIQLIDQVGRTVITAHDSPINLGGISSGLYFVVIRNNDDKIITRLWIQ